MTEIERLARHGYMVFAFDKTGCMESGGAAANGFAQAIADLDAEMEQSASDYVKLQELCLQKEEQEMQLMELYEKWETVSAQLEEARG
jgi:hypothetical protein